MTFICRRTNLLTSISSWLADKTLADKQLGFIHTYIQTKEKLTHLWLSLWLVEQILVDMPSFHASWCCLNQKNDWIHASYLCKSSLAIISYYFCDQNHHIALRLLTIKLQFFIYQQMKPQIQPQSRRCGSKIQSNGENFTAPTVILKYFKYKNILDNERRMSFHQGNR